MIAYLDTSALVKRYVSERGSSETIALTTEADRISVTESLVERAESLAWEHSLRGYDAVHLASALSWRESIDSEVVFATFDGDLWDAAHREGMNCWPAVTGQ